MRRMIIAALALLLVTGGWPVAAQPGTGEAHARLGQFSPGTGQVDVYLDQSLTQYQALRFGTLTNWFPLAAGVYRLTITRAGEPLSAAIIDLQVEIGAGERVTLAIIGEVIRGTATVFPLVEDFSPIAPGETRLTVLHAIPDLGLVDAFQANGSVLFNGLAYPGTGDSGAAWDGRFTVDLTAGMRILDFVPADMPGMIMLRANLLLAEGANHLVVLAGLRASPVTVLAATEPETEVVTVDGEFVGLGSGEATVRAAHFASGAGALDVFVNGEPFGEPALTFGAASAWQTLPAGTYEVAMAPAGTPYENAVLIAPEVAIPTGGAITLAAVGLFPTDSAQIYPVREENRPVAAGEARLIFLHAMPDLGPVSVTLADGTLLFAALDFPGIDGPPVDSVDLVAGPRALLVRPFADPATVLLQLPEMVLIEGARNLVVLAGLEANPATFLLVTPVVE